MDDLLDRNTTQFAYDYLIKNDDLPDELGNILISRANKNYLKAAGILGEGISLSSEQKQSVISRMEYLDSIGKLEPDFQEWLAEQQKEPKE